ncbi:MAG TPA: hypothetical protein VNA24_30445 [Hyalangium sp.]|nr:hypothetical protein [Hyalangium sp.]
MKIAVRILLPTLLLGTSVAFAQENPVPPAAEAPAEKHIDVSFRGSLRDALKRIAEDGGLNLVATGDMDTPVEVRLQSVTAEQALRTVASTYSLRLDQDGSIFTLRPQTAAEKTASVAPPAPLMAPVPPVPPVPSISADDLDPKEIQKRVRDGIRRAQRRGNGAHDVVARGQSLEVKASEEVDNAVVYGGNLVVKGRVEEDAVAFGGNLDIYGVVEGDAHAFGGNVVLHEGAAVEGDVSAIGGTVIRKDGTLVEGSTQSFSGASIGALVADEIKDNLKQTLGHEEPEAAPQVAANVESKRHHGGGIVGFILRFAALFGLGFLGQIFFPARMKELSAEIKGQPVKSALTGLLGFLALIPITAVLAITLIGIPVAVLLWLVVPVVVALGLAVLASEIGLKVPVLRGRKTQAAVLALGLLILLTVGAIPGIGAVVLTLATLVAFGAIIRTRFGQRVRGFPEPITPSSVG